MHSSFLWSMVVSLVLLIFLFCGGCGNDKSPGEYSHEEACLKIIERLGEYGYTEWGRPLTSKSTIRGAADGISDIVEHRLDETSMDEMGGYDVRWAIDAFGRVENKSAIRTHSDHPIPLTVARVAAEWRKGAEGILAQDVIDGGIKALNGATANAAAGNVSFATSQGDVLEYSHRELAGDYELLAEVSEFPDASKGDIKCFVALYFTYVGPAK